MHLPKGLDFIQSNPSTDSQNNSSSPTWGCIRSDVIDWKWTRNRYRLQNKQPANQWAQYPEGIKNTSL